ncbi:MAG: yabD [Herbinix sp.]|jgi:TatD DNase family protein|nr:yabD [Herbinix sp.]
MIFETHAHYDDEAFDIDRDSLLEQFPKNGIDYIVNICAELNSVQKVLELADQYPYVYAAVGIHPSNCGELNEENFAWVKEMAQHSKSVAIGEIGLDYYWDTPERQVQKEWFSRQMDLAKELKLPMVIHSRDAANDTYQMMKEAKADSVGAIIHCFGYGVEQARQYLNMGFYLGIGGVLTFTNGKKLKEVVEYAPLEQLVLETDSPYLAPVPHRGTRNNSNNLTYVAREIARIKQVNYDTVLQVTYENAKRFYNI